MKKKTNFQSHGAHCDPVVAVCVFHTALDAAWDFQRDRTVPNTWRTEVKDESSSSEDDDEEEEEEQEEEASSEEEEVRYKLSRKE